MMDFSKRESRRENLLRNDEKYFGKSDTDDIEELRVKAEAFDQIAYEYYLGNFGTMTKTDFETLLFSLYLERILKKSESDLNTYSGYTLSKQLGITQERVGTLG